VIRWKREGLRNEAKQTLVLLMEQVCDLYGVGTELCVKQRLCRAMVQAGNDSGSVLKVLITFLVPWAEHEQAEHNVGHPQPLD
jgi:hypothetical protein